MLDHTALAETVTSLWRAQRKIGTDTGDELPRHLRQAGRHLQSGWDTLTDAGVDVLDHEDTPFDPGLSLHVVAYQPRPELRHEIIIETIRPTIYLGDERIQIGHVVVGVPEEESSS